MITKNINNYLKKVDLWKSHVIFKTFVKMASDKEDKIEDIINNSAHQLHNFVDNTNDLDSNIVEEHNKFRTNFYKYNKEVLKNNNSRVNDMLYNNRNLIIETHKK